MDKIIALHRQQALAAAAALSESAAVVARQLQELAALPLKPTELTPEYLEHAGNRLRRLDEVVAEASAVWARRIEASRLWAEGHPESVILARVQEL